MALLILLRFWGIFFIDTSSVDIAEQGFSTMARICKVGERTEDFKRFLTNSQELWLLILDNADDPSVDISQFFPVGDRGTILVTSRNPESRRHATVGSRELREMECDEAINLLLRCSDLPSKNQNLRDLALPIVRTLGCLALAVNHAGASIRQGVCSLQDYLDNYTRHRKKLLSNKLVKAGSEYKYTVYTTWEISVESIKEIARKATDVSATNALELLTIFGFCHFDDITEDIFGSAWGNFARTEGYPWWASNLIGMIRDRRLQYWDSMVFNEAIRLLASYSLIHVSGSKNRISLHPLVHSWIRDSLSEELHLRWWNITISNLALALKYKSVQLQGQLKVHLRHCIGVRQINDLFPEDDVPLDRVEISRWVLDVYDRHPWKDGLTISERAFEYSRRRFGDECDSTCGLALQLAQTFISLSQYQKASDLLQGSLDVSIRVAGPAHPLTLLIMRLLSRAYMSLDRKQEALEVAQKKLAICEKSLDESDGIYQDALQEVAMVYDWLGRHKEAVVLFEKVLTNKKGTSSEESPNLLQSEFFLARAYGGSGQHQAALDMFERLLEKSQRILGEDHPNTFGLIANTAVEYNCTGQPEKGIPLIIKALDVGSRIGLDIEELQRWEKWLIWLRSKSANTSSVPEKPLRSQEPSHPQGEETTSMTRFKFW